MSRVLIEHLPSIALDLATSRLPSLSLQNTSLWHSIPRPCSRVPERSPFPLQLQRHLRRTWNIQKRGTIGRPICPLWPLDPSPYQKQFSLLYALWKWPFWYASKLKTCRFMFLHDIKCLRSCATTLVHLRTVYIIEISSIGHSFEIIILQRKSSDDICMITF